MTLPIFTTNTQASYSTANFYQIKWAVGIVAHIQGSSHSL